MDLSPRQRKFVAEYTASGNGTRAYQNAYGVEAAEVAAPSASRLLRIPKVKEAIEALAKQGAEAAEITAERVLRELSVLAFMPVEIAASVPGLATQKTRALDLLARHLGLLVDRTEINMAGGDLAERMREAMGRVRTICGPEAQGSLSDSA